MLERIESKFNQYRVFDLILWMLGPILVVALSVLMIGVIYVIFFEVIPAYHFQPIILLTHVGITSWLILNIIFNYVLVIITDPGSTKTYLMAKNTKHTNNKNEDEHKDQTISIDGISEQNNLVTNRIATSSPSVFTPPHEIETTPQPKKRFCKKCNLPKPPRAHHCGVCKKCVLRLDHHCPWVLNCVGFYNHKYFLLFLLYLWLGCFYCSILIVPFFFDIRNSPVLTTVAGIFTIVFTAALFFFNIYQYYLILWTAQTQYEISENNFYMKRAKSHGKKYVYPYNLGFKKNFQLLFGVGNDWWNFLLPSLDPPPGDGVHFKSPFEQRQFL